ncbi:hypothetical protein SAMD00019534_110000 [Acytostelium subglobosum LB1]|uniref:hypothetical protein n=1 Tax=Acytostelium subglobosum LB1 TaxID=1410327 RepID=UPI0006449A80|nr:hypothetical protein SAMD00019534_110000 [Acytostelium subglobosum LB1]GAM27824.1 hypothetical protein SAMD00019534_110000 [Acytostelium subglobosum LB1]|eukprot:XP_012749107.1 hypothetical protein SAMD00019534_110000 [Acytostelium subglobosum LB1]
MRILKRGVFLFNTYNRNTPTTTPLLRFNINNNNNNSYNSYNSYNSINQHIRSFSFTQQHNQQQQQQPSLKDLLNVKPRDSLITLINTLEIPDINEERERLIETHSQEKRQIEQMHQEMIPSVKSPREIEYEVADLRLTDPTGELQQPVKDSGPMEILEPDTKAGEIESGSGTKFKGGLSDSGLPHGAGEYETARGDIYLGEFQNGKKEGAGRYMWRTGNYYDGFWKADKRCGLGKYQDASGAWFEGIWDNDLQHGPGVMIFGKTDIRGEWEHGELVRGHEVHQDTGIEYFGQFKNGKWNGVGKLSYKDGTIFEGLFKAGVRHGQGRLISRDQMFESQWINGAPSGKAKLTSQDFTCEGEINNGEINNGTLKIAGRGVYVGGIRNFAPHGYGEECLQDGCYYQGQFVDGKRHGMGTHKWSDGTVYRGTWVDDYRVGWGQMIFPNGKGWEGEFNEHLATTTTEDGHASSIGLVDNGQIKQIDLNNIDDNSQP